MSDLISKGGRRKIGIRVAQSAFLNLHFKNNFSQNKLLATLTQKNAVTLKYGLQKI